jgi:hypothetical protein
MACLYHMIEPTMRGTILYPLNQLERVHPDIHHTIIKRYEGRTHVMNQRISALDHCLWNDVVFFMAVHPVHLKEAMAACGFALRPFRYFVFESGLLDCARLAVITKMSPNPLTSEAFDPARLAEYQRIPEETLAYWRRMKQEGREKPFLFNHIPHIVYKGVLDTTGVQVIDA